MAFKMKQVKFLMAAVVGAFIVSGPLQHTGALPKSSVGDFSISALKLAQGAVIKEAHASCGGSVGGGSASSGGFHPFRGFSQYRSPMNYKNTGSFLDFLAGIVH